MVNDRQSLDLTTFALVPGGGEVEWRISAGPVPYPEAVAEMESRAADIADRKAAELVWLLEHPPLYTSGTSGKAGDAVSSIAANRLRHSAYVQPASHKAKRILAPTCME